MQSINQPVNPFTIDAFVRSSISLINNARPDIYWAIKAKTLSMSCNDDLEEFIKIVKIDSFEIAILNLLHQTLQLCEQGPTS